MSEGYGVIYRVTNTINGKKYIGQTTAEPFSYWEGHLRNARRGYKKLLYFAVKKYGERAFTFEVIWSALDKEALDMSEDYFIVDEKTMVPLGYNMKGGGARGKFSEQMRRNHSVILKKAFADPQLRIARSETMKKVAQRPDNYERRVAAAIEVNSRPGLNERKGASIREAFADPEVKRSFLEIVQSEEHRQKLREGAIKQFSVPGAREAVAERTRQQFADPEKAARHRAAYDNPETKAKISSQSTGKIWITNGKEDRVLWPGDPTPPGRWRRGMSRRSIGASRCRWINNGVECRMASRNEPLPDGWKLGKIDLVRNARNAGMRWITDGSRNEMIAPVVPVPEGWRLGMTRDRAPRTVVGI